VPKCLLFLDLLSERVVEMRVSETVDERREKRVQYMPPVHLVISGTIISFCQLLIRTDVATSGRLAP